MRRKSAYLFRESKPSAPARHSDAAFLPHAKIGMATPMVTLPSQADATGTCCRSKGATYPVLQGRGSERTGRRPVLALYVPTENRDWRSAHGPHEITR
jgi:hypothetical protein